MGYPRNNYHGYGLKAGAEVAVCAVYTTHSEGRVVQDFEAQGIADVIENLTDRGDGFAFSCPMNAYDRVQNAMEALNN